MSPDSSTNPRPCVRVLGERETGTGWIFRVALDHPDREATEHEISLSWVDHDHWTGGTTPPSRLITRLGEILLGELGTPPPARFDAATIRRWIPDLDESIRP